jgi:DNA replication protein DnaC
MELVKNQDTPLTLTNNLKKCGICGDYQEFIREEIKVKGQVVIPAKVLKKFCYCQEQAYKKIEADKKRQEENAKLLERYKVADLPPRFINWSFDSKEPYKIADSDNKTACIQYVDCFDVHLLAGTGIFMVGEKGLGKTTMAVSLLKELLKNNYTGLIIPFREIINRVQATNDKNSLRTQRQVLDEF